MTPTTPHHLDEQFALFAAGALTVEEARAIEAKLLSGCVEGERRWAEYEPVVAALLDGFPSESPPASAKEQLLAALPVSRTVESLQVAGSKRLPRGITFQHQHQATFVPTPLPGITIRMLNLDMKARQFTALMKLEPGARYPSHHHDGEEECLVLEGSLRVGETLMVAGDYQRCAADSDHVDQWSETGALIYLKAPVSLLALGKEESHA